MKTLAKKYNTNATTILFTLRREGAETRGSGDHQLGNFKYSKEEEDKIIKEYESRVISIGNLAKELNASSKQLPVWQEGGKAKRAISLCS